MGWDGESPRDRFGRTEGHAKLSQRYQDLRAKLRSGSHLALVTRTVVLYERDVSGCTKYDMNESRVVTCVSLE